MELTQLKNIIEGALLAAGRPLEVSDLEALFDEDERPSRLEIGEALEEVAVACAGRGYELKKVASGYRFQVRQELSSWVSRLWDEKPQKYSRSLLETLALIAYRQPTTRGDIEEIRGVSVSSQTIKTLLEREWVRVVGHRDVPGRPALYATTRQFLDYFNLASLEELPPLSELRDLDELDPELELEIGEQLARSAGGDTESAVGEDSSEQTNAESVAVGDEPAVDELAETPEPGEAEEIADGQSESVNEDPQTVESLDRENLDRESLDREGSDREGSDRDSPDSESSGITSDTAMTDVEAEDEVTSSAFVEEDEEVSRLTEETKSESGTDV